MDENSILDPGPESNVESGTSPPDAPPPLPPSPVSGGPHRKKSSSFQITKVQYPRRGSNDCGDDSNDDSHTEDTSDITDSVDQPSDTSAVLIQNANIDNFASRFTVVRTTGENSHTYKRGRWLIEDSYQDEQMGREMKGVFVPRNLSQVDDHQDRMAFEHSLSSNGDNARGLSKVNAESSPGNIVGACEPSRFVGQNGERSNATGPNHGINDGTLQSSVDDGVQELTSQSCHQQFSSCAVESQRQVEQNALPSQNTFAVSRGVDNMEIRNNQLAYGQSQFQQPTHQPLAPSSDVHQNSMPLGSVGPVSQGTAKAAGTAMPVQTFGHQSHLDLKSQFGGTQHVSVQHSFVPGQQPIAHGTGSFAPVIQQYQAPSELPTVSLQTNIKERQPAFKTADTASIANVVTVSSRTDYEVQQTGQRPCHIVSIQSSHPTQLNTYQNGQAASLPSTETTQAVTTQIPFGMSYTNQNERISSVTPANFTQHQQLQQSSHGDVSAGVAQSQIKLPQFEAARDASAPYTSENPGSSLAIDFQSQVSISGLGISTDAQGYQTQGSTTVPSSVKIPGDHTLNQNFQKPQTNQLTPLQNTQSVNSSSARLGESGPAVSAGQISSQLTASAAQSAAGKTPYPVSSGQHLLQTGSVQPPYGILASVSTALSEPVSQPAVSLSSFQNQGMIHHGILNTHYSQQMTHQTQQPTQNTYQSSSGVNPDSGICPRQPASPTKVSTLRRNDSQQNMDSFATSALVSQQAPIPYQVQQGIQMFPTAISQSGEQSAATQPVQSRPDLPDSNAGYQSATTLHTQPQQPLAQQIQQTQTMMQNTQHFIQQPGQQLLYQQPQQYHHVQHSSDQVYNARTANFQTDSIPQQPVYREENVATQLTVKTSEAYQQAQPMSQVLNGAYQQEPTTNMSSQTVTPNFQQGPQHQMQEIRSAYPVFLHRESQHGSSVHASQSGRPATITSPQPQLSQPSFPTPGLSQPMVLTSQGYQPSSQYHVSLQGQHPPGSQPQVFHGANYAPTYSAADQAPKGAGQTIMTHGNQVQPQTGIHAVHPLSNVPPSHTSTAQLQQSSQGTLSQNFTSVQSDPLHFPQQVQSPPITGNTGAGKEVPLSNLQQESGMGHKQSLHLVMPPTSGVVHTSPSVGTEVSGSSLGSRVSMQNFGQYANQAVPHYHPQVPSQQSAGIQQQNTHPVIQQKIQPNLQMPTHAVTAQQSAPVVMNPGYSGRTPSALSQQLEGQNVQPILQAALQIQGQVLSLDFSDSAAGGNSVAIDNRIVQALDIVKDRLIHAVREEVDELKLKIEELNLRIRELESENSMLRGAVSPDLLAQIDSQKPGAGQN